MKKSFLLVVCLSCFVFCSAPDELASPVSVKTTLLFLRNGAPRLASFLGVFKDVCVACVAAFFEAGEEVWIKPYVE